MMSERNILFILLLISVFVSSGNQVQAVDYDYSYTPECLARPLKPQYNGGQVINAELNNGLNAWSSYGGAKIETREYGGNKFIVALNRNGYHDSLSQKFNLEKEKFYIISAWLQVSNGSSNVAAVVKTSNDSHYAGWSIAQSGCWSMFKGGIVVSVSGPAYLYFESDHPSVELWVDSVSLQPFSQEEWIFHRLQSNEKMRKSTVKIRAVDIEGTPLINASLAFTLKQNSFGFGCTISQRITSLPLYQNWFLKRFRYTVFANQMKWTWNEPTPGHENYVLADRMLQFVRRHGIIARGHNVVWDNKFDLPNWVQGLNSPALEKATRRRQHSIMGRYSGQFIHWDVVNENLHFSYLEEMLGSTASTVFYKRAHVIDKKAIPFLNDLSTIENATERVSSPSRYLNKIREMRSQGYRGPLGIGLEGHFYLPPNLPYMRTALDMLASARLPIWVTELDVDSRWPKAAEYLEAILRELRAHPAVGGVIIWAPWSPPSCYRMCLTDANFNNLPTGKVVDKLLAEWNHWGLIGTTDADGYFQTSLSHGDYELNINHPRAANSSQTYSIKVAPSARTINFELSA